MHMVHAPMYKSYITFYIFRDPINNKSSKMQNSQYKNYICFPCNKEVEKLQRTRINPMRADSAKVTKEEELRKSFDKSKNKLNVKKESDHFYFKSSSTWKFFMYLIWIHEKKSNS